MELLYFLSNILLNRNFIINLFLEIIFIVLSLTFFQKTFKIQFIKRNNLIYIFTNIICFILGCLIKNYVCGFIFEVINSIIIFIYLQKISVSKTLTYFCLKLIIMLNIQFCIFKPICIIFNYDSYIQIIGLPIFRLSSIILISLIGTTIYFFVKHFKFDNIFMLSMEQKSNSIIAIGILDLIIVSLIFYNFFEIFSQNLLYFLALNIYFYFSISNIIHLCNILYSKQKIDNLTLCNSTILAMYDDTRAFKHDFHNIIQAIGGYIWANDIEGLKKYYSQISNDCKNINNLSKLSPELINNPAIYNILADKYQVAGNSNIQVNIDIMLDLNNLNMKIYELTRILGILLDNAIEASKECNEKCINILFKQDKYKQLLIIENTYKNKQVSIEKIFEKDYTTKPHNTGLGLWEVRKILRKNNNLNLHTTKNNDYFSQQLEIYTT